MESRKHHHQEQPPTNTPFLPSGRSSPLRQAPKWRVGSITTKNDLPPTRIFTWWKIESSATDPYVEGRKHHQHEQPPHPPHFYLVEDQVLRNRPPKWRVGCITTKNNPPPTPFSPGGRSRPVRRTPKWKVGSITTKNPHPTPHPPISLLPGGRSRPARWTPRWRAGSGCAAG